MTPPFQKDEKEEDELLLDDEGVMDNELDLEVTLDDVEELEEEENAGHKLQTFDPNADDDIYASGAYFDE
ncbi:MAG: hypothetical protein PHH70_00140 [Candidatus Gracilibacteria bacterium]|nr:hypothetical protein [Candidatus Gracilibacteria bacterium]